MNRKSEKFRSVILTALIIIACIAAVKFSGAGATRSSSGIGYLEHSGPQNWSADYLMLDGTIKHTIRPEPDQKALHIEVVTESGGISVEVTDKEGNTVFHEDHMQSADYDVTISGNVVVRVDADKHKGSFSIEASRE